MTDRRQRELRGPLHRHRIQAGWWPAHHAHSQPQLPWRVSADFNPGFCVKGWTPSIRRRRLARFQLAARWWV